VAVLLLRPDGGELGETARFTAWIGQRPVAAFGSSLVGQRWTSEARPAKARNLWLIAPATLG